MKAKVPLTMQTNFIVLNRHRLTGSELAKVNIVDIAPIHADVAGEALRIALELREKGRGVSRNVLGHIKSGLYTDIIAAAKLGSMKLDARVPGVDRPATIVSKL